MCAKQTVFRIRRNYNRWVADETLEDYALRFTAKGSRRWSTRRVANTAFSAITFLALEAIGASITLNYGFFNAITAIVCVGCIIFFSAIPVCYYAAKGGVDIDLLTRGAGFGYIGSVITSLIYASFTFIFFALESSIMASALELTLNIPVAIGYVISSLIVIPMVTHGIRLISWFQSWTQPLWIVLQLLPLYVIFSEHGELIETWIHFEPSGDDSFNLVAFGCASLVLFSLIAQIGEQVDYLRFMPAVGHKGVTARRWWAGVLFGGPGWVLMGMIKVAIGSFLAVLLISSGMSMDEASDPNLMYLQAFSYLQLSPELTLILLGCFVVLSQIKINVTNSYAGSIAWSNFFSRLTHSHPGRIVWVVFNVAIALILMEMGIYQMLESILGGYAIVALSWVGALVADLVINKPLGLRPPQMEFKRAHLYDINPVGVGSMLLASALGFCAYFGMLGEAAMPMSAYLALLCSLICAPLIAWMTGGKYYLARQPGRFKSSEPLTCCICGHDFEPEDMSHCPAYGGLICSLCCALDSRCQDMCKPRTRIFNPLAFLLRLWLSDERADQLSGRLVHFLGLFLFTCLTIAALLGLVSLQLPAGEWVEVDFVSRALVNVFLVIVIIAGIVAWMFSLIQDSRRVAEEEMRRQTELLRDEIEAHKLTDQALQEAKEHAEAANNAKSRYLSGISHELRSPLNAIMGYAQLMERDARLLSQHRDAMAIIRRSSEFLADMIEGLLDISRIEAGRLELARNEIHLVSLLEQVVGMFLLQAEAKGIRFRYELLTPVPELVRSDEKRLRQILINLISNAVKYTQEGEVYFSIKYRNQVAEFTVRDTGCGIPPEEQEKIFQPFERLYQPGIVNIDGTGLGLTITRLLTEIMGGEITLQSELGKGSEFRVSLLLASADDRPALTRDNRVIIGYEGPRRTLFIVDDEPSHRSLLHDILQPLGFNIIQAPNGQTCLDMLGYEDVQPQIFLLDVSMPGLSGWELAQRLREQFPDTVILMISADASEKRPSWLDKDPHDGYLVKPVRVSRLLELLAAHSGLVWNYRPVDGERTDPVSCMENSLSEIAEIDPDIANELTQLAQIGYAAAIRRRLDELEQEQKLRPESLKYLREANRRFNFRQMIDFLRGDT